MRTRILILLALIIILSTEPAFACSPAPHAVQTYCTVREDIFQPETVCLNEGCSLKIQNPRNYVEIHGSHLQTRVTVYQNSAHGSSGLLTFIPHEKETLADSLAVNTRVCNEDFSADQATILLEVQKWYVEEKHYFWDRSLDIEPFTDKRQQALEQQDYFKCAYAEYQRVGNWLVVKNTTRPYCQSSILVGFMCPMTVFSLGSFVIYLFTHINSSTIPYVLIFMIAIGLVVAFLIYLKRRGDLGQVLRPNRFNILATGGLTILFGCMIGIPVFLEWIIPSYLLTSAFAYLLYRQESPKSNVTTQKNIC
jgi:hypothetical protein